MPINVHIINHTHWDREWFLTSVYTSQWIPDLIDKLLELTRDNPDFRFLLDGQTLIIEDLLNLKPDYREKVERLVRSGRLLIGPYYCQPDWRLTGGELLYRNLLYGRRDMKRFGAGDAVGWLVDTFGHISQAPQLHRLFDLNSVYVWRGVPRLEPYFVWKGSFGQDLFAINLFGGYRNLYGVSHAPEVAAQRLLSEVRKLSPFYPTPDIPLFDGYDLEQNPEDPVRFYHERGHLPADVRLLDSSPIRFSRAMQQTLTSLPTIEGELNSGKYGATFPGALSTRTYLKIMHHDCEHALFQRCEPLAVLAALNGRDYPGERYEAWTRKLLQNAIHDCICGVSVDPVHEKMERSYQELFQAIYEDIGHSLAYIFQDFASGTYAISTNPFPYHGWRVVEGRLFRLRTEGIGAWPVDSPAAVEQLHKPIETFEWRNAHYEARVDADGVVHIDDAGLGQLVVMEEVGDAYSDEAGEWCEVCKPDGSLRLVEQGPFHAVLAYETTLRIKGISVSAAVRLIFDDSPLIRWLVELDSRGVNFRVEMRFEAGHDGVIRAGMPFDRVERPWLDDDFLPRELDEPLNSVLLGQREVEAVHTFPFQDHVTISGQDGGVAVLAKGLRAYRTLPSTNAIAIPLRRSVEWLTRSELRRRVGDAGPNMYVPDARCERRVRHELAVMVGPGVNDEATLLQINAGFQNPPLLVRIEHDGSRTEWKFLQENAPVSSLTLDGEIIQARFFNPTENPILLHRDYHVLEAAGATNKRVRALPAKAIATLAAAAQPTSTQSGKTRASAIEVLWQPAWRVDENRGAPDPAALQHIEKRLARQERSLQELENRLKQMSGKKRWMLQHRYYAQKREWCELRLSLLFAKRKLDPQTQTNPDHLYRLDPEIAALGAELNELRIKRRIYDYVVAAVT